MKTLWFAATLAALAFVQVGCSRTNAAEKAESPSEPPAACSFKEGRGLVVSRTAAEFIGLRTAEFNGQLPAEALLRTVKGDFVYVQNSGHLLRTQVKLGAFSNEGFAVQDGLYEGDVIAVAAVKHLWLAELQATNGGVGCSDGN